MHHTKPLATLPCSKVIKILMSLMCLQIVNSDDKRERLDFFLREQLGPKDKVIVFCGRKSTADDIASDLILAVIKKKHILLNMQGTSDYKKRILELLLLRI